MVRIALSSLAAALLALGLGTPSEVLAGPTTSKAPPTVKATSLTTSRVTVPVVSSTIASHKIVAAPSLVQETPLVDLFLDPSEANAVGDDESRGFHFGRHRPYGGYGHHHRPYYGGYRPYYGGYRPYYGGYRPYYGGHHHYYGGYRPYYGGHRPY